MTDTAYKSAQLIWITAIIVIAIAARSRQNSVLGYYEITLNLWPGYV